MTNSNPPWLDPHVSALQRRYERLDSDSPLGKLLHSRIAVLGGDFRKAAQLSGLMEANRDLLSARPGEYSAGVATLLWAQEFELAEKLVQDLCPSGIRVRIQLHESAPPLGAASRLVFSKNMVEFRVSLAFVRASSYELYIGRWLATLPLLEGYLVSEHYCPGSVLLNLGDAATLGGLAFCSNLPSSFLIPDHLFIRSGGYRSVKDQYDAGRILWAKRSSVAFWRGSPSGGRRDAPSWRNLPRVRLCEIAASPEAAGIVDAGISHLASVSTEVEAAIRQAGLYRDAVPAIDFGKYKYNIDIDGNSNSWPGLFVKLCAGGTVLKVASPKGFRQWYYDRLHAWINYVPVESDMSDLIDKVVWLRDRDDRAHDIGEQGQKLAYAMTAASELNTAYRTIADATRHAAAYGDGAPRPASKSTAGR